MPDTPALRHAYLARLIAPPTSTEPAAGAALDQAMVTCFAGPASFTGEDCVEIACHGGTLTPATIVRCLQRTGARLAEPGEFTRRALQNNKIDLLQAEAIADIIHAQSESARSLAQDNLAGTLSERVHEIRSALTHAVVLVEAAIDFSLEEHVYTITHKQISELLTPPQQNIAALLRTWNNGRLRADGVRIAIVGRPNAGKSTLLNLLVGSERALVSSVAGTTRDYIEDSVIHDGIRYALVDTAGLRETEDEIEAMGIARTRQQLEQADAIWWLVDAADPPASMIQESTQVSGAGGRPVILVWTKLDQLASDQLAPAAPELAHASTAVSLLQPDARNELESMLVRTAHAAGLRGGEHALITRERHRDALTRADEALSRAQDACAAGLDHELVALDVRMALDAVAELVGAVTSDDILNRVFDGFCIGK
jgi:tRNA modification GTPase